MNSKRFTEAMSEIDNKYVDEAIGYKKKFLKSHWFKWTAIAACLILIIGGIFMRPSTHDGRKVISEYRSDSSGSYAAPSPGEVIYTSEVREAREKYKGKDVTFLLAFNMFKDDGTLSNEEQIEEYQRLISLGYELYTAECWTYQGKGEKKYYTVVVGYFTESDLSLFRSNPEYGYMFDFVTNGDGSGISVEEKDIITDFPTNHS